MTPISRQDIDAMRNNGYDRDTIAKAEAQLDLQQRGATVAEEIRRAFAGVTLGDGVGLQEAQGLDDCEERETLAKYRETDEKEHWERIPAHELNQCHSSLSFFDAAGMRFHLPAYLIAELTGEFHFNAVFSLTLPPDEHRLAKFVLLDPPQRQAVRAFLLHVREDPDYNFHRKEIEAALACCWLEGGRPPETAATP